MNKKQIKDWTILIYADGNNELEPEIWKSKMDAEKEGSSENVNVIMQIARTNRELARIIRPSEIIHEEEEEWTGVRRYYVLNSESKLISNLGKINMAHPLNLYEFIKWGMDTYPAKRYMVAIASHGASFIAAVPDLSLDAPYMMGVPQMCRVLNMILKDTGNKIDVLVLDMCYMNSIEIMYELGKNKNNTVENVITYTSSAPIEGLPYDKLIHSVKDNSRENNNSFIIRSVIDNTDLNLVGIEINHGKLKKIKNKVNSLAYSYLINEGYRNKTPYELINNLDSNDPWYNNLLEVRKSFNKIIIYSKSIAANTNNIINIMTIELYSQDNNIDFIILIYYSLSFGKNNYWLNVLSTKSLKLNENINMFHVKMKLEPFILHPTGLLNEIYAINFSLSKEEIQKILNNVLFYNKWNYNEIAFRSSKQAEEILKSKSNKEEKWKKTIK